MNNIGKAGDQTAARSVNRLGLRALAMFALLALGGCATAPRLAPIESKSSVLFVVVPSPPAKDTAKVHDTGARRGFTSGVRIGAVTGAMLGLACGPFAYFCVPIAVVGGATDGALVGAFAGAATSLPYDTRVQLIDRLNSLRQSIDPLAELQADVLDQARPHWELAAQNPTKIVTLEVQNLTLTSAHRGHVALVMTVLVHTTSGTAGDASAQVKQKRFEFVSQDSSVAAWLDEHGEVPQYDLRRACQQIAADVVSELTSS